MDNHHCPLLKNSVHNLAVKKKKKQQQQQQQEIGWGPSCTNSVSNKLLNRSRRSSSSSSSSNGSGKEHHCLGASRLAGVRNPVSLVDRCLAECEEVEEEEEEAEEVEEKERVVEEGSAGLRSAWIQRIIPRALGEEKEKEKGYLLGGRDSEAQESLVGFWKKKTSCVADVGSLRVALREREAATFSNEKAVEEEEVQRGDVGGVCSVLGSRQLQGLGYQSGEDGEGAAAAAAGGNRLSLAEVISSGHVSNAGGSVVVAPGLGLQFDGGGGARNWAANNSGKERDINSSSGFLALPPLSLFAPFKHTKELGQHKADYQGSSSSGKMEVVVPLLTPLLPLSSFRVGQINVQRDKMAEITTQTMDNVPSLTPLYVPSKSSLDPIDISSLRDKGLLGLGEMLNRPADLTKVFSPFKSCQDANDKSPCSSKTASLPLELVLNMDPNINDSLRQEDTGTKSRVQQPEINFEKCQQKAGSSANLCIAMPSPSSLQPGFENKSGNQEPSQHSRGNAEICRLQLSAGQRHLDCESQHLKVQEVALEDPNVLRLLSKAGCSGSSPPVSFVGGTPGYQSPLFQSTSSCAHLKAVGERSTAVQGGHPNSAMQSLQQNSTERRRGLSNMKESQCQELGSEDRDRVREHTTDNEEKREERQRQSATEQLEGVTRRDIASGQVSEAMKGWHDSSRRVHLLGQGSMQAGDAWQEHSNCNRLIDAPGDRSGGTSSRMVIHDPSMDLHSSYVSEEIDPTSTQAGNVSGAEQLPNAPKVQAWLQRWMRPLTPRSNISKCPQRLSASMVSSGSGLGTANRVVSDAYTSRGTESEEVVLYSERVQITASDETGLELERQRSHSVMGVNQFARTERGNVFVGEDQGSRLKRPFFLGYNNHPSAAAMALVGAASRRSMPIPPQRPGKRVALMAGTVNSPPHEGPQGSSPTWGGTHL